MQIDGKIVVITGASFGIGAATARAMARKGARLALLARTPSALEQIAGDIRAQGGAARIYPVDLADPEAVERAAATVTEDLGVPDIIVHSAGAGRWLSVEETSPAEAVQMMTVPYFAAFFVTRAFLPAMLRRGSGHFVTVGSPAGRIAWPGAAGYIAARWALQGFTEALRADLRGTGLRVASVVAGTVRSTYFAHNPGAEARIPKVSLLGPVLTPEQVADAVVRAVEQDRREIVMPLLVRLFFVTQALSPRLVAWIGGVTGWRRPDPSLILKG